MPCYSDIPSEYDIQRDRELDKVTRMLCALCKRIEEKIKEMKKSPVPIEMGEAELEHLINADEELTKWWKKHKAWDRRRERLHRMEEQKKAAQKAAMEKLSYEELKALGLTREASKLGVKRKRVRS